MNRIEKYLMKVGVSLFTDYVPTWVLKSVFGEDIDHIKLRNGLNTAARLTSNIKD